MSIQLVETKSDAVASLVNEASAPSPAKKPKKAAAWQKKDAKPAKDEPLMIVIGGEGKGVSRLVRESCDLVVSIPISSAIESLNASVAAAIALYSVSERRVASKGN